MKNTRQVDEFEKLLKSDVIVSGGFLGDDIRSHIEIIESDRAELSTLNVTAAELSEKMRQVSAKAAEGLGTWIKIDARTDAKVDEARGALICPWPHQAGPFAKRVTNVRRNDTGQEIRWSDLNIHLIAEHSFFEGRGSSFRVDPRSLFEILFC